MVVIITGYECLFDEQQYKQLKLLGGMSVCTKPDGYKTLVFSSGLYKHKLVCRVIMNADKLEVDHKDGNTLNNKLNNLRLVTSQENKFNTSVRKNKKSQLPKGVTKHGTSFRAAITHNYTQYTIGTYPTVEEAEAAYKERALKYQGSYSSLNR